MQLNSSTPDSIQNVIQMTVPIQNAKKPKRNHWFNDRKRVSGHKIASIFNIENKIPSMFSVIFFWYDTFFRKSDGKAIFTKLNREADWDLVKIAYAREIRFE